MPPCTPTPAARPGVARYTVAALVAGLGLAAASLAAHPQPPPPAPLRAPHVICVELSTRRVPTPPPPAPPPRPQLDAADLVGIYQAPGCRLTLDASGTYTTSCGDRVRHRYAIAGDRVVLEGEGDGGDRLTAAGNGRLVTGTGAVYTVTGGVR